MIEPALGDKQHVRQVKEWRHSRAQELVGRVFGAQRSQQNIHRGWIGLGQVSGKGARKMLSPIEQLERVEAGACVASECAGVERRMRALQVGRETADERRRKK
jgi:hypothetical protein